MKPRWRLPLLLMALVALALGSWSIWRAPLVDVWPVQAAPLVRSVQASGRVASLTRVDVGATLTGRVARVAVQEGQHVAPGAVLVQLEDDDARAALAQAQAALSQAQARLTGLQSAGRTQAQAALEQARANLQAARADATRTRQLVDRGFVSAARLDDAQRALAVAQAAADAAQAQVQANADRGTDWAQAQAQLTQAHAGVQAAQARLGQTVLRAPAAATVLARNAEPGQIVQPGRPLVTLALDGPSQIKAPVDERFLAQLAPGQRASVRADAYPDQPLAAQVMRLAPLVDAQRGAVEVTLALTQPAPAFWREDLTLSVEVETARRDRALWLPLAALRGPLRAAPAEAPPTGPALAPSASTGATAALAQVGAEPAMLGEVWRVRDGRVESVTVRLGLRNLQAAEVLSGLQAGDAVLLTPSAVVAGQRVRPRPVAELPGLAAPAQANTAAVGAALGNAMGR